MRLHAFFKGFLGAALVIVGFREGYAGDFEVIVGAFSEAAEQHDKKRVAVMPFHGPGGRGSISGVIISERLMTDFVASGKLQVVERSLLQTVMREQRLETQGIVDPRLAVELGRILGVDAIITGTVIDLRGEKIEVNARLIDVRTARILSAGRARIKKDWDDSPAAVAGPIQVAVPPLSSFGKPVSYGAWMSSGHDDTWGLDCGSALRQADQIERSMVELKARFWASRLRDRGFSMRTLTRNPGSEISNPEVKSQFYDRLRTLHKQKTVPRLSVDEMEMLSRHEKKLRRLNNFCRS